MKTRCPDRSGQTIVLVGVFAATLIGMSAIAIDLGWGYFLRSRLQTAADAAALAGALDLQNPTQAQSKAEAWSSYNGFTKNVNGVTVTCSTPAANRYRVTITQTYTPFLARIFRTASFVVDASATAQYDSLIPLEVAGLGTYGVAGAVYLGAVGPLGQTATGDSYSTLYRTNGTANFAYDPNGYNFEITIPANYATANGTAIMNVDIFDAGYATGSGRVDESNSPASGQSGSTAETTSYRLYRPDSTINDYSDDVQIASYTITANTVSTQSLWYTPTGFAINTSAYPAGTYRLNMKRTSGDSVNTFNLRAGPPSYNYATPPAGKVPATIRATGHICVEFVSAGTAEISLGFLPSTAASANVHISKFDTDQGATTVTYFLGPTYATRTHTWAGQLASNDTWDEDVIVMPSTFSGGVLKARYTTGNFDTTNWQMYFEGYDPGRPARVKLVE